MAHSNTTKKTILILLITATLLPTNAFAQENVTELKIESITTPVRAGENLEFSFLTGNRIGPPCSAEIRYWIESGGNQAIQGNDTIYLGTGEVETEDVVLLISPGFGGVREFFLQMKCNEATILASRTVNFLPAIPKLPAIENLKVSENEEGKQIEFAYELESGLGETVAIIAEESIIKDSEVVWSNIESKAITGKKEIERLGPALPTGDYKVTVKLKHAVFEANADEAHYYSETVEMTRDFSVKGVPLEISLLSSLGIMLGLSVATAGTALGFIRLRKNKKMYGSFLRHGLAKPAAATAKNRLCPVEAESNGVLEEYQLAIMLHEAGFKGKKLDKAIRIAEKIPITQLVKGCVLTDKTNGMSCETTIEINLSNNTNRNWKKLKILATVPEFLAEDPSEVNCDSEMQLVEGTRNIILSLEKVAAMQSATISYKTPILVSQAEANSVQLPAVVSYKQGKPLTIAQVKVERPVEETEEKAKEFYAEIQAEEKQAKSRK
jgi:hypothetical protein